MASRPCRTKALISAMTGEARGGSRAAAPGCGFSVGKDSVSLTKEVLESSPCPSPWEALQVHPPARVHTAHLDPSRVRPSVQLSVPTVHCSHESVLYSGEARWSLPGGAPLSFKSVLFGMRKRPSREKNIFWCS